MRLALLSLALLAARPLAAQGAPPVDTAAAVRALGELADACRRDGGALWGVPLCGPTLLVDPVTRTVVASRADSAGALRPLRADGATGGGATPYAGTLPRDVGLANTSAAWGGERWAMVLLPLPDDRYERVKLLVHESFHRLQPELGLAGRDPVNAQLDQRDGRRWLRLELRALARALVAPPDSAARFGRDALLFRAWRNRLYPGSDTLEAALERQEGIPEYTGARVALLATGDSAARVASDVARYESGERPFVRSFAYATGPALGLLLDRWAPDWRSRLRASGAAPVAPAALLAGALHFRAPATRAALQRRAEARASLYGGAEIVAQETARERERRTREAAYRARLVTGPLLVLRSQGMNVSFDPRSLFPLGGDGTVYPTGTFSGPWGKLEVASGGALVASDFTRAAVPAPADTAARPLRGDGWTLELAPGWTVRPVAGRRGSWEVVKQ